MNVNLLRRSRRHIVFKYLGILTSVTASVIWVATLVILFLRWGIDGFRRYDTDDGQIVYISNVGAEHKPGFILGTVTTSIPYFFASLFTALYYYPVIETRLRRILSLLSVVCVFFSGVSLILLSILDSRNHKGAHYTFVGLFVGFSFIAAILYLIYRYNKNKLNWVLAILTLILGLFFGFIIAFIVIGRIGGRTSNIRLNLKSMAASYEWTIAILFAIYLILFYLDLQFYKQ